MPECHRDCDLNNLTRRHTAWILENCNSNQTHLTQSTAHDIWFLHSSSEYDTQHWPDAYTLALCSQGNLLFLRNEKSCRIIYIFLVVTTNFHFHLENSHLRADKESTSVWVIVINLNWQLLDPMEAHKYMYICTSCVCACVCIVYMCAITLRACVCVCSLGDRERTSMHVCIHLLVYMLIMRCALGAHLDVGLAERRTPCRFVGNLTFPSLFLGEDGRLW